MIYIETLQLGDIVHDDYHNQIIHWEVFDYFVKYPSDKLISGRDISPVPINEYWLTELNFEKKDVGWTISVDGRDFVIMESSMNDGTWSILTLKFGHGGLECDTIFEIKYVHELQHFLRLLYAKMTWE